MFINYRGEKIVYYRNTDFNQFFDVYMAGVTLPNPTYKVEYLNRKTPPSCYYVFEYVISGRGYLKYSGKQYEIGAGDLYFYHKKSNVVYGTSTDDPYMKIWLNFNGRLVDSLADTFGLEGFVCVKCSCREIFERIHGILETTDESGRPDALRSTARLVYRLFDSISEPQRLYGSARSLDLPERIRDFIDNNLMRDIRLEDIAQSCFISPNHCIRVFRDRYLMTPMNYMRKKRLEEARELMLSGNMSISNLSDMFCFSDRQYFTRCFCEEFGLPPAKYRQAMTQNRQESTANIDDQA